MPISCPIRSVEPDLLEFLGPFDEPPFAAGSVVRTDRGVCYFVDLAASHVTSALFLVLALSTFFRLWGAWRRYCEPELYKAADGFGAAGLILLAGRPSINTGHKLVR
ncbi:hypothetical protein ABIF90_000147 [Bradyrhizobium japonicum]